VAGKRANMYAVGNKTKNVLLLLLVISRRGKTAERKQFYEGIQGMGRKIIICSLL
jgi:hypothetical protein